MTKVTITIAAYRIAKSPGICAFDGGKISTLSSVNNVLTSSPKICIAFKDNSFFDQMVQVIPKNTVHTERVGVQLLNFNTERVVSCL